MVGERETWLSSSRKLLFQVSELGATNVMLRRLLSHKQVIAQSTAARFSVYFLRLCNEAKVECSAFRRESRFLECTSAFLLYLNMQQCFKLGKQPRSPSITLHILAIVTQTIQNISAEFLASGLRASNQLGAAPTQPLLARGCTLPSDQQTSLKSLEEACQPRFRSPQKAVVCANLEISSTRSSNKI